MALRSIKAFLLAFTFSQLTNCQPEVHIPSQKVTYRGSTSDDIEHFQGIPFAKDTSGERRFAPPEPYVPEEGTVIDASHHVGTVCPQTEAAFPLLFDETPEMGEDCLNLRIARPAGLSPDSKLPVVVWIHGGGVVKGSAYDSHFNPDNLLQLAVEDGTPVIYAAINYRMSIFGFPRLPLLADQKSLNLGLRDQRMGVQWIRDHIFAFGGDPERITVYGLSAGGTFASMHTLAFGGERGVPFQQAWMMSGPPGTALNMTSDATTAHTLNVAERLGCEASPDNDAEVLRCMRAAPMEDVLDAAMTYSRENHPPAGLFTFIPSVDGDFFPQQQSHLIRDGRFVKGINMVFGWTQDDGALNVGDAQAVQSEEDMAGPIHSFASELSPEELSELFALYPASAFEQELHNYEARRTPTDPAISVHFLRVSRILRDLLFTCSSIDFGYEMFRQTRETNPGFDSVRLYQLNQSIFTPMMAGAGMPYLGAIHGSDTPYIFNGFPEGEFDEADQELATSLSRSLIQFAYSGSPISSVTSRKQFPRWPPAYTSARSNEKDSFVPEFNIQVVGGPYGTGPALIKDEGDSSNEANYRFGEQGILGSILDYAGMGSSTDATRDRVMRAEELRTRCAYLKSLDVSLGR